MEGEEAFCRFLSCFPQYQQTLEIDSLREAEYPHLDEKDQICLDYTGMGIFSGTQKCSDYNSGYRIGLSYTSANLATHAMYPEDLSTEAFFRRRILRYLSLDEDDYYIVFTASALSAFKLLGESYPFHEAQNLLVAYDHACENVAAIRECARAKSANAQAVNISYPGLKLDADDLKKKLQRKKKMYGQKTAPNSHKGLFVYPYSSRITGRKNSSQWIPQAQENGWHVLLDITGSDPKMFDSLGLSLFLPDFLICSFYNLFGEDPTGFGCLVIKKSLLRLLGDSSRARAIGMVNIVIKHSSSPSQSPNSVQNRSTSESSSPSHSQDIQGNIRNAPNSINTPTTTQDISDALTTTLFCKTDDSRGKHSIPLAEMEGATKYYCEDQRSVEFSIPCSKTRRLFRLRSNSDNKPGQTCKNQDALVGTETERDITCKALDHADMLGYIKISIRLHSLASWLTSNLSKLRHPCPPHSELVKIYSQILPVECGSTIAFNLLDSTGNLIDPKRVQMLADRHSFSIRTDLIEGKHAAQPHVEWEESVPTCTYKWLLKGNVARTVRLSVNCVSLCFLNSFSDVFRFWQFISRFLEPEFIHQELWHYQALNQETIEM